MKAILVLELDGIPDTCDKCPAFSDSDEHETYWCRASDKPIPWLWKNDIGCEQYCPRPDWCTLKEMPKRLQDSGNDAYIIDWRNYGWNNCIDYIECKEGDRHG